MDYAFIFSSLIKIAALLAVSWGGAGWGSARAADGTRRGLAAIARRVLPHGANA